MSKDIEDLQKKAKEESEILLKKKALDTFKTQAEYERVIKSNEEIVALGQIKLSENVDERVELIVRENDEYMEAAKNCKRFISKSFDGIVPNFGKNINLIGGSSGEGKSTTVANIILETLRQGGRTLILTNEEYASDVYNRITCLYKGWIYANHDKFTQEQKDILRHNIPILARYITVVTDSSFGPGTTTTIEGVKGILESVVRNGDKYDSIIIDYIQKVAFSKANPKMQTWEVLSHVMQYLDGFKNRYLAPIILMAQLHNGGEGKNAENSFESRLRGFKGIIMPVTCAMELVIDKKRFKTKFVIRKNRWYNGDLDGQEIEVGWFKGKYVDVNNPEYRSWSLTKQGEKIARTMEKIDGTRKSNGTKD